MISKSLLQRGCAASQVPERHCGTALELLSAVFAHGGQQTRWDAVQEVLHMRSGGLCLRVLLKAPYKVVVISYTFCLLASCTFVLACGGFHAGGVPIVGGWICSGPCTGGPHFWKAAMQYHLVMDCRRRRGQQAFVTVMAVPHPFC